MLTTRIVLGALVLFTPISQCSSSNDSPFALTNKATGFCFPKSSNRCQAVRWTTGQRLYATATKKCLGAQGRSVGSEVSLFDCDDRSELQKWECRNDTLLALKGQQLYVSVLADESVVLSKTVGPNNHLTIQGTSSGPCTQTHRELYTIDGNAFGKICAFPFLYKNKWYGDCTTFDSSIRRLWCSVGTRYENQQWGYCPTTSTEHWKKNVVTGAYYQVNAQSALTWAQAEASCTQQGASMVSVSDPNEQAFISAPIGSGRQKLWIGLVLNSEHGWKWTDEKPFRYLRWNAGHPLRNPGYNCAFLDSAGQHNWQSSSCSKKMGYICYKDGTPPLPPQIEQGFCASPWIPYNGHCFQLYRTPKTWADAQKECRKEGGDLVSVRNLEDQSFMISQLGYASTDQLWIGLNDRRLEGLFEWSDHSAVSFCSWEYEKPSVSGDAVDCVLIQGENGNWADRSCGEKHGFICMKQSATERPADEVHMDQGCKAGWKKYGSYCYFVGTSTKTFQEAMDDCKTSDSYLADVSNGVDNAFLISLVGMRPEKYFWLGLSNQENIDVFVWTNTKFVRFTHWNNEMPGNQQGCVAMATGAFAGLWDVLPCANKEKYICKRLAEGAVLTPAPPTPAPPKCAEGWTQIPTRNFCFKIFLGPRDDRKTWFEARDYCRAVGGDLLSVHSPAEQFVGRHGRAWIGLHVSDPSTGYEWSDGSPVNFQHWQEGEPNNFNNVESCVELRIYSAFDAGSWNDVQCESFNDWVCQIRAGVTPIPPPNNTVTDYNTTADGWLQWRGHQYLVKSESMAMEDARHFCQQRHGDLISMDSKAENTFIWQQISRQFSSVYIGMSADLDGTFWWMDGSPVGFQLWEENQPDFSAFDQNCVTMAPYMGFWSTCNCGGDHMFVCKRANSSPINTTAAPTLPPKGGCPVNWKQFDSKCYRFITNTRIRWEEARQQCINMGGNLASVPTRRVQVFLTVTMGELETPDLWIGLNGLKQDRFYWSDGKRTQYTNWGYSNHHMPRFFYRRWNEEDCVLMTSNPAGGIGKWFIKSCNDTNGLVCQRNLDPKVPSKLQPKIPETYVAVGNDSIKVMTQNRTWKEARRQCEVDGAHLANLRNEVTHAYVELLAMNLKAPLWIGLNREQTDGYFRYIDGWHLSNAGWAEGEPSSERPCVYLDVDGKWKTAYCNQTMSSVCMQSTDVPPTQSADFPGVCPEAMQTPYMPSFSWLPFKGHCYLFVIMDVEWADAASSCARLGADLVTIEDPAEQEFIQQNLEVFEDSYMSFWIGLYKTHRGRWLWVDKTALDYTNWSEDVFGEFGEIRTADGRWGMGIKWQDLPYICKIPKVIPTGLDPKAEPLGPEDHRSRAHTSLVVVLVVVAASALVALAFFLYKRSPHVLPTFDNPLYFNSQRSRPDVVDTNKLIENTEEENAEPIMAL